MGGWCGANDAARLKAESIDWKNRILATNGKRLVNGLRSGLALVWRRLLKELPSSGPIFPHISADTARPVRRIQSALSRGKVAGVSFTVPLRLAERAKALGYTGALGAKMHSATTRGPSILPMLAQSPPSVPHWKITKAR